MPLPADYLSPPPPSRDPLIRAAVQRARDEFFAERMHRRRQEAAAAALAALPAVRPTADNVRQLLEFARIDPDYSRLIDPARRACRHRLEEAMNNRAGWADDGVVLLRRGRAVGFRSAPETLGDEDRQQLGWLEGFGYSVEVSGADFRENGRGWSVVVSLAEEDADTLARVIGIMMANGLGLPE